MQGQRSIFDLNNNQGSNSNSTTSMDESDDWNILSPMERQLLNNDLSNEINFSGVNTNNYHNNITSFSSWDVGESSSRSSLQDRVSNDSRLEEQRPINVNLNIGYEGPDGDDDGFSFMDLNKSEANGSSSHGIGSSEFGPGSPLGSWGLSCKRKALEGTSSQSLTGVPEFSRNLNTPSSLVDPVPVNRHEPPNTQYGVAENSQTHFGLRGWGPYNNNNNITSTGNPTRRTPNFNSSQRSSNRQMLLNEFLDHTSTGTNSSNQQPPLMHIPSMPRSTNHFPWSSNIGSRNGSSSSSSSGLPLERSSEPNSRSLLRNNVPHHHNFVPSSERNLVQDPTSWSLATGSRNGSGSGGFRPFNSLWTPQLSSTTMPSQQRSSELPPWTLFPSAEVESGGQRGLFPQFPAGSSSTTPEQSRISSRVPSQRHHYQPFPRSGLLMESPGDDWRALAADIEGRQRLVSEIRQVLNAMRRGENLRAEDYLLFDPFINGVAELHDRHRDMRLDVDNMSYEELLALEERIGDVNTGLSEDVILKLMKQRKHIASFMAFSTHNLEPCCICQEEYETGQDIGSLDCGHDFHRDCIKQWLSQKNICPICKMTGLAP